MNLKTKIIVAVVIVLLFLGVIAGALFFADKNGYNRAVAIYNAQALEEGDKKKKEQEEDQKNINHLAHQYQQAVDREQEKSNELAKIKKALREKRKPIAGVCVVDADYAHYIVFNQAIRSADLQENSNTRIPDEQGDGLEVVQYSVEEYNRVSIKLNTLIDVVNTLECVVK